jgi:sugar transferase (PEP-CTERM system associated)
VIRLFEHDLRRETVLKVLFDIGLLILVMVGIDVALYPQQSVPFATRHGLSLTGGMLIINSTSGLYHAPQSLSFAQCCVRAAFALALGLVLAYAVFRAPPGGRESMAMQFAAMLSVAAVVTHRVYANYAKTYRRRVSRTMVFGSGPAAATVGDALQNAGPHIDFVGYYRSPNEAQPTVAPHQLLSGHGSLRECALKLGVDKIVVALAERRGGSMPLRELLDCKTHGIQVSDISTHFEKALGQIKVDYVNAGWLVFGDGFNSRIYHAVVKQIFDILCALLLLVLASPFMLLTALLIRMESKGPVLYRQQRVGKDGKPYDVLKFRSMRTDAEQDGKPRWAAAQDDRITRVGRVIRKYRIDEFPQLLNVIKGDMSLVGPRPERPYFVEQLTRDIPYYAVRHSIKPGITGWAQVRYQYGATLEDSVEKLQYDLYYVKNHTLFLDMVILFETVGVVVSGQGAR